VGGPRWAQRQHRFAGSHVYRPAGRDELGRGVGDGSTDDVAGPAQSALSDVADVVAPSCPVRTVVGSPDRTCEPPAASGRWEQAFVRRSDARPVGGTSRRSCSSRIRRRGRSTGSGRGRCCVERSPRSLTAILPARSTCGCTVWSTGPRQRLPYRSHSPATDGRLAAHLGSSNGESAALRARDGLGG